MYNFVVLRYMYSCILVFSAVNNNNNNKMDADIEDESECDDVEGKDLAAEDFEIHTDDEEDDLFKDPDFIDSGTYWLSDEPKERFVQIAAHRALKRAEEEEQLVLFISTVFLCSEEESE